MAGGVLELRSDPTAGANSVDVLTRDLADARATAERLRKMPEVNGVMTLDTFIPADQEEKLTYIRALAKALEPAFKAPARPAPSDEDNVAALNRGEIPIHEPGLGELVARSVAQGRLSFSYDLKAAVSPAEVVFIAVGTPSRRGDGHADLSYVYAAAREIAVFRRRTRPSSSGPPRSPAHAAPRTPT